MPIYLYRCDVCGHADETFQKMSSPDLEECPRCIGSGTPGYYHRIPTLPHTDLKEFHTPIEMYSVACNSEEELRELQQKCPGVEISDDPASELYGVPVVRSRAQKLQVLKATNSVETN